MREACTFAEPRGRLHPARWALVGLAFMVATALAVGSASAAPYTTVERTIQDCDSDQLLEFTFGESHLPFDQASTASNDECVPGSQARELRLPPSASIINFLQLSDFQMVDEESPARVEWLDGTQRFPGLQPFSAAYRPQESLTTQITEAMVRQARNTVSPVTSKPLDLTILTGDNADSQQFNETRWFIDILDGTTTGANPDPEMQDPFDPEGARSRDRKIDPNSGIPTPACPGTPGSIYDGVRDSGLNDLQDDGYYEPDFSVPNDSPDSQGATDDGDGYSPYPQDNFEETPGRAVRVRDYRGLFERANEPFEALGLGMPWYSAFGNHDALVQGNSPEAYFGPLGPGPAPGPDAQETFNPVFHNTPPAGIATGCVKIKQPSAAALDRIDQLLADLENLPDGDPDVEVLLQEIREALLGPCTPTADPECEAATVPFDPRRCFVAKDEPAPPAEPGASPPGTPCQTGGFITQHFRTSGTPVGHGFAPSPPLPVLKQGDFCDSHLTDPDCLAASYGRPPQADLNDDGYYSFTPKPGLRFVVLDTITDECGTVFCSEGSVDDPQFEWLRGQLDSAAANGQYVVVFSHHTLRTIRFPSTDGTERPMHNGQAFDRRNAGNPQGASEGETLEDLYCHYPNVLAHVAGHEHENYVQPHECGDDQPPPPTCAATPCTNPHFWEISTAAHIDWPQQSRMIELVNIGGKMSFVLTILDHEGQPNPMGNQDAGTAPGDIPRLAAIGREISYNDYQGSRDARGERQDRNVILPTDRPPPPYVP